MAIAIISHRNKTEQFEIEESQRNRNPTASNSVEAPEHPSPKFEGNFFTPPNPGSEHLKMLWIDNVNVLIYGISCPEAPKLVADVVDL